MKSTKHKRLHRSIYREKRWKRWNEHKRNLSTLIYEYDIYEYNVSVKFNFWTFEVANKGCCIALYILYSFGFVEECILTSTFNNKQVNKQNYKQVFVCASSPCFCLTFAKTL